MAEAAKITAADKNGQTAKLIIGDKTLEFPSSKVWKALTLSTSVNYILNQMHSTFDPGSSLPHLAILKLPLSMVTWASCVTVVITLLISRKK